MVDEGPSFPYTHEVMQFSVLICFSLMLFSDGENFIQDGVWPSPLPHFIFFFFYKCLTYELDINPLSNFWMGGWLFPSNLWCVFLFQLLFHLQCRSYLTYLTTSLTKIYKTLVHINKRKQSYQKWGREKNRDYLNEDIQVWCWWVL